MCLAGCHFSRTPAVSPKNLVATLGQFRQSYPGTADGERECGKSPTGEKQAPHAVRWRREDHRTRSMTVLATCEISLSIRVALYPPEASRQRPIDKLVVGREGGSQSRLPMHTGGMDSTPTAPRVNGTHVG